MTELEIPFRRVLRLAQEAGLPGLVPGTSYGTPALKAGPKSLARMKDAETLVLLLPLEHKELLMESEPGIYFETDHYRGWPAVLIRLAAIGDDELGQRLRDAYTFKAPRTLLRQWHESTAGNGDQSGNNRGK